TEDVEGDFTVPADLTDLKLHATDWSITSLGNVTVEGGLVVRDITLVGAIEVLEPARKLWLVDTVLEFGRFQGFEASYGDITLERCLVSGSGPGMLVTGNARLEMRWTKVTGMQWGISFDATGSDRNHEVVASLIYNCLFDGIRVSSSDVHLRQTTVVGNGRTALAGWNLADNSVGVENSILSGESWTTTVDLDGPLSYAGVVGSVIHGEVRGVKGIERFQVGTVSRENPLLTADYYLEAESPARGLGRSCGELLLDLDGNFFHNPPSAGCYEYVE
ncbi:MAG: hypothetical protein HYZ08_01410, partial [Candidatus Kerfeldbacteria bacterium]|nr:hypothetical protein [Candidatus Kerfeldbacteria bacterium]